MEAILEATARILREGGADSVSTNQVARVAGVSVGSLYQYFPNKEALIQAVSERYTRWKVERLGTMLVEVGAAGPAALVRAYIHAAIELEKEDPLMSMAVTTAMLTKNLGQAMQHLETAQTMVLAYMQTRPELGVDNPEQASWVLVTSVDMLMHAAQFERAGRLDEPAFEEEVVRLALRYLGLEADGARSS